jgi:hypothetical protein
MQGVNHAGQVTGGAQQKAWIHPWERLQPGFGVVHVDQRGTGHPGHQKAHDMTPIAEQEINRPGKRSVPMFAHGIDWGMGKHGLQFLCPSLGGVVIDLCHH